MAQQPVRAQLARLVRQFSAHCLACGLADFPQAVTQVLFSPLHFIGSADAIGALTRSNPKAAIDIALIVMALYSRFLNA
ncbi:MAG TPA: hypothetical protein VK522_04165 [Pseudolabrys sp.]|nr:hypothetical protein [Pseudolabrys sp.]